tara:strand:+ start:641 stop:853 length:213 start_codon:yes stop_codon:yes gene_type:complete
MTKEEMIIKMESLYKRIVQAETLLMKWLQQYDIKTEQYKDIVKVSEEDYNLLKETHNFIINEEDKNDTTN